MCSPTLNRNENNSEFIQKLPTKIRDSFKAKLREVRSHGRGTNEGRIFSPVMEDQKDKGSNINNFCAKVKPHEHEIVELESVSGSHGTTDREVTGKWLSKAILNR